MIVPVCTTQVGCRIPLAVGAIGNVGTGFICAVTLLPFTQVLSEVLRTDKL